MFEITLLLSLVYAVYWSHKRSKQALCMVCNRKHSTNTAVCSDHCADVLYADSTPAEYPNDYYS